MQTHFLQKCWVHSQWIQTIDMYHMEREVCKTGIFLSPCYLTPASKKCVPYTKIYHPVFGSPFASCCALSPEQCLNSQNNPGRKGPTRWWLALESDEVSSHVPGKSKAGILKGWHQKSPRLPKGTDTHPSQTCRDFSPCCPVEFHLSCQPTWTAAEEALSHQRATLVLGKPAVQHTAGARVEQQTAGMWVDFFIPPEPSWHWKGCICISQLQMQPKTQRQLWNYDKETEICHKSKTHHQTSKWTIP